MLTQHYCSPRDAEFWFGTGCVAILVPRIVPVCCAVATETLLRYRRWPTATPASAGSNVDQVGWQQRVVLLRSRHYTECSVFPSSGDPGRGFCKTLNCVFCFFVFFKDKKTKITFNDFTSNSLKWKVSPGSTRLVHWLDPATAAAFSPLQSTVSIASHCFTACSLKDWNSLLHGA